MGSDLDALNEVVKLLADAVDADCQPISKDEVGYVKPSWLLKVREAVLPVRAATSGSEKARLYMAARALFTEASLTVEVLRRLPSHTFGTAAEKLKNAEKDRDWAYEQMEKYAAAVRKEISQP